MRSLAWIRQKNMCRKKGMEVYWNGRVSQNYGELATSEGTQKIWLEDEKSLEAKMKLIQQYELAGVDRMKLGFERADVWPVIRNIYSKKKKYEVEYYGRVSNV